MDNTDKIIEVQRYANEAGLKWTKSYIEDLKESREIREECLMNQLTLNRIDFANKFNPAVAVYGESQVGKSYLVGSLLNTEKSPLAIYDGIKSYGFIEDINPYGQGKESTSIITRFTINRPSDMDNKEYPICAVMLTPVDVVLILCDAYYNDIKQQKFPEKEEIQEEIKRIRERYMNQPKVQETITDVDIFEIKDYFENIEFAKGEMFITYLQSLGYFETLSECIGSIDFSHWRDVFGYLWNRIPLIGDVFDKLINTLRLLDFRKRCYIKIDPLLRDYGTILQVDRIYQLFGFSEVMIDDETKKVEVAVVQDMEVWNGERAITIQKSEFCALATELILTISDINDENAEASELLKEKPFLKYMDVLDFPGARSRLEIEASQITNWDTCLMLLRGKVAYLFNKYSRQYLISNLMFCHHALKSEVSTLKHLLQGWINSTIGKNPEERAKYIRSSEISPLFIVGTKFNDDLWRQPIDSMGSEQGKRKAKENRWALRFDNLRDLIHESALDPWFSQWVPDQPFKNMYLLRDYQYSCQRGIYEGYQVQDEKGDWHDVYDENGRRRETGIKENYVDFIRELKETFLENKFVQAHFENPNKSWDEAAALNHDGSQWIIDNLNKAAKKARISREMKFDQMLGECFERLYMVLRKKYHDDNADSRLREALEEAGDLDLRLNILFGKDKYFFSEFIDTILVREDDFHDIIMDTISGIKLLNDTDLSTLFALRDEAGITSDDTEQTARQKIKKKHNLSSDEKVDEYLKDYGLTITDVINPPQVMNVGHIIVDAVEKHWFEKHLQLDRFQEFVERGLPPQSITALFKRLKDLYYDEEVRMTEVITMKIMPYIASPQQLGTMVDMLADLFSECINKYVNTMGAAYFGEGLWKRLKDTVLFNSFNINVDVAYQDDVDLDEDKTKQEVNTVFEMFDNIEAILNEVPVNREKLQYFSNYRIYRLWTERMKLAYLAKGGVPNYDVDANNALRIIILNRIINVPELKPLIISSGVDISCFE